MEQQQISAKKLKAMEKVKRANAERVKEQCDLIRLENLNLRGGFKTNIMNYIADKYPEHLPLYEEIYNEG